MGIPDTLGMDLHDAVNHCVPYDLPLDELKEIAQDRLVYAARLFRNGVREAIEHTLVSFNTSFGCDFEDLVVLFAHEQGEALREIPLNLDSWFTDQENRNITVAMHLVVVEYLGTFLNEIAKDLLPLQE